MWLPAIMMMIIESISQGSSWALLPAPGSSTCSRINAPHCKIRLRSMGYSLWDLGGYNASPMMAYKSALCTLVDGRAR